MNKRRRFIAKRRRYLQRHDRITCCLIGWSPQKFRRFEEGVRLLDGAIVGEFNFPPNARPLLVEMPRPTS
jgi:hypothetical protein